MSGELNEQMVRSLAGNKRGKQYRRLMAVFVLVHKSFKGRL